MKFGQPGFNVAGPCSNRVPEQRQGQDNKKTPWLIASSGQGVSKGQRIRSLQP
jgi:hypothetical protein